MFHYKTRRIAAFTIIEMLIVMVILALSISLVSPVLLKQISSYKIKSEIYQLESFIKSIRDRAFFSGKSIVIKVNDGVIIFEGKTQSFKNITLLDQELTITNRYQISPKQLKYKVIASNETKVLNLDD